MRKVLFLSFLLLSFINLSGCMTVEEAQARFDRESPQELCMDYLTKPTYNIWYEDRRNAIIRRGIDCTPYAALAQAKIQSDQAFTNAVIAFNQSLYSNSTSSYSTSQNSGFTKVCYYDGVGGPSALTISSLSNMSVITFA